MTHVSMADLMRAGGSRGDVPQLASRAAELRALWQQEGDDRAREKLLEKQVRAAEDARKRNSGQRCVASLTVLLPKLVRRDAVPTTVPTQRTPHCVRDTPRVGPPVARYSRQGWVGETRLVHHAI